MSLNGNTNLYMIKNQLSSLYITLFALLFTHSRVSLVYCASNDLSVNLTSEVNIDGERQVRALQTTEVKCSQPNGTELNLDEQLSAKMTIKIINCISCFCENGTAKCTYKNSDCQLQPPVLRKDRNESVVIVMTTTTIAPPTTTTDDFEPSQRWHIVNGEKKPIPENMRHLPDKCFDKIDTRGKDPESLPIKLKCTPRRPLNNILKNSEMGEIYHTSQTFYKHLFYVNRGSNVQRKPLASTKSVQQDADQFGLNVQASTAIQSSFRDRDEDNGLVTNFLRYGQLRTTVFYAFLIGDVLACTATFILLGVLIKIWFRGRVEKKDESTSVARGFAEDVPDSCTVSIDGCSGKDKNFCVVSYNNKTMIVPLY